MPSLQRKINKGKEYWYIIESYRENNKVKTRVIEYIGNTKKLQERLMNTSYGIDSLKSYSHGDTHALLKMARELEIEKTFDKYLPFQTRDGVSRSLSLLLIAIGKACCPTSKMGFSEWFVTTTLPHELDITNPKALDSNHFWEQMDGITEEMMQRCEDEIAGKILKRYNITLDKLALDFTNYFTYIGTTNTRCKIAKRGKNKQKRNDLRQFALAVVTSKKFRIPLYSQVYEGNKNDAKEFREYLELLKKRVPNYNDKDLTLVFDGGSVCKENLKLTKNYICRFPLSSCKELYEIDTEDYDAIKFDEDEEETKYKRIKNKVWGNDRTLILTFSQELYAGEVRELETHINKAIEKLKELNKRLENPKSKLDKSYDNVEKITQGILRGKLNEIITVIITETDGVASQLEYSLDICKKEEIIRKYYGKQLIATNRNEWSDREILECYYDQNVIEEIFKDSKHKKHFSMRPQYHWTDDKIKTNASCTLLGLQLTRVLNHEISQKGIKITNTKLLDKLSQVREGWIKNKDDSKVTKKIEDMDVTTQSIWNIVQNI